MATGTAHLAVWDQLITTLQARSALSGVAVRYALDDDPSNFVGELMWLGVGAEQTTEQALMSSAPVKFDEEISFPFHVQVIRRDGDQAAADDRCQELFAELQQAIASDLTLSIASTAEYQVLWLGFDGWDFVRGPVRNSSGNRVGHGSRYDVTVRIRSRIK